MQIKDLGSKEFKAVASLVEMIDALDDILPYTIWSDKQGEKLNQARDLIESVARSVTVG